MLLSQIPIQETLPFKLANWADGIPHSYCHKFIRTEENLSVIFGTVRIFFRKKKQFSKYGQRCKNLYCIAIYCNYIQVIYLFSWSKNTIYLLK